MPRKQRPNEKPPQPHVCDEHCRHTCGEAGGIGKHGACTRKGGWGRTDVPPWSLNRCASHVEGPEGAKQKPKQHATGTGDSMFGDLGLNAMETSFVLAYCGEANCNATAAAEQSGMGTATSSRASLQVMGSAMLKRPHVKQAVAVFFGRAAAESEEILARMTRDARLDVRGIIKFEEVQDENGKVIRRDPVLNLTPETLQEYGGLIREIETNPETGGIVRVKLNDSQSARRDLARIRKLYSDAPSINIFQLQEMPDEEIDRRLRAAEARFAGPSNGNGKH